MKKLYNLFFKIVTPIVKLIGKVGMPERLITGEDYYKVRAKIEIGDVFLTKTKYELSNIINPNKYKHAALYVGDIYGTGVCYVVEAIGKGVVFTNLVDFLTNKDSITCTKPKFIRNKIHFESSIRTMAQALEGLPYDYNFEKGAKAFYCFELNAEILKNAYPELQLKCREIVKGKRIYDFNTFLDSNFFSYSFSIGEKL